MPTPSRSTPQTPGALLLRVAALLFDEATLARIFHPAIADFQVELREAGSSRRRRLLARWRGYRAFWSLVLIAPFTFWRGPAGAHDGRTLLHVSALVLIGLVAGVILMLLAATGDLAQLLGFLPEHTIAAVGRSSAFAFLAGPLALALLLIWRRTAGESTRAPGAAEATLFGLLSVTVAATTSTALFISGFIGIARTGSGGIGPIARFTADSVWAMLLAIATVATCLLIAGAWTLYSRRQPPRQVEHPPMSRRLAIGLSLLLCLTILVVDQVLRLHHGLMDAFFVQFDTGGRSGADMARMAEWAGGLLFFGGALLTIFVLVAGVTTWRASRHRAMHPVLAWTSNVALVVVLAGAGWHATAFRGSLSAYAELQDRMTTARES